MLTGDLEQRLTEAMSETFSPVFSPICGMPASSSPTQTCRLCFGIGIKRSFKKAGALQKGSENFDYLDAAHSLAQKYA
jgi:hypothetical protein